MEKKADTIFYIEYMLSVLSAQCKTTMNYHDAGDDRFEYELFIHVVLIILLFPEFYKLLMEHKKKVLLHCGSCYILISVLM